MPIWLRAGATAWWANRLQAQGRGTASTDGSVAGDQGAGNYAYSAAKSSLATYLQLRQRLYRHGVTVLTIKPGWVDTPMTADIDKTRLVRCRGRGARHRARRID